MSVHHGIPEYCFYDNLEDLIYDKPPTQVPLDLLPPPIKIEDISSTNELLTFVDYIKEHSLFTTNPTYKYLAKVEAPIRELDRMIGMSTIKANIANQVIYYAKKLGQGAGKLDESVVSFLNTAIYGAPGCGKTTIAHIIGKIYLKLGILTKDEVKIGNRSNMIAKYLGQTAIKTTEFLNQSRGCVVFLDEVYQLGSGRDDGNRDSFAKECIDTINQFITENPGEIVIIVAGYREQVKQCFFAQNAGLERRFRWSYTIEPYKPAELLDIFCHQAKLRKFQIVAPELAKWGKPLMRKGEPVLNKAGQPVYAKGPGVRFFEQYKDLFQFGGGDTETLLDKCIMINEKRTIAESQDEGKLNSVDIEKGMAQYKEYVKDRIGNQGDDLRYRYIV